jgi:hypothetical protein
VPVARLIKDSSLGDRCVAFKAHRPTAEIVGLAIAAGPISRSEEVRGLEALGAFARVATDRREVVRGGYRCAQRRGEMYCDREEAGSFEEEGFGHNCSSNEGDSLAMIHGPFELYRKKFGELNFPVVLRLVGFAISGSTA